MDIDRNPQVEEVRADDDEDEDLWDPDAPKLPSLTTLATRPVYFSVQRDAFKPLVEFSILHAASIVLALNELCASRRLGRFFWYPKENAIQQRAFIARGDPIGQRPTIAYVNETRSEDTSARYFVRPFWRRLAMSEGTRFPDTERVMTMTIRNRQRKQTHFLSFYHGHCYIARSEDWYSSSNFTKGDFPNEQLAHLILPPQLRGRSRYIGDQYFEKKGVEFLERAEVYSWVHLLDRIMQLWELPKATISGRQHLKLYTNSVKREAGDLMALGSLERGTPKKRKA